MVDTLRPVHFHATNADLAVGTVLSGGHAGIAYPEGEGWRAGRVWLSADPGNAGAWWGHDQPDVKVYAVIGVDVRTHAPNGFDEEIGAEHAEDQFHAESARIERVLDLSEWNDYHRTAGSPLS